jgi:hypothetical protein
MILTRLLREDNIKMLTSKSRIEDMDCIYLVQVRDRWHALVSAVMNLRVPLSAGNFLTSCGPVSFSTTPLYVVGSFVT